MGLRLAKFLLALVLLVSMGLHSLSAQAVILKQTEAPGQILYQSRQTLRDRSAQVWQAIAFKRIQPSGEISFTLRLVGFPEATDLQHPQPLELATSLGAYYEALDISQRAFASGSPDGNVGQYDLMEVLPDLKPEIPLQLFLKTTSGSSVIIPVPPFVVREWKEVAARS